MSPPRTPWGRALDELLSDGEWHALEDVYAAVIPHVPPGPAYRVGERLRRRPRPRGANPGPRALGTDADAVRAGARALATEAVRSRLRRGTVERRVGWVRSA